MSAPIRSIDPSAAMERLWDVIVIGTGMGGATTAFSLARQGFSVLMIERGQAAWGRAEEDEHEDEAQRLDQGRWPERAFGQIDENHSQPFLPLGCGIGGSTLFFGAAMERFERSDFEDVAGNPHPTGGWPIGYDAFRPWYEEAERLYRVHGTHDPLGDPTPCTLPRPGVASEQDQIFMRDFAAAGLHPYRVHVGITFKPGCLECLGRICPLKCKSDARTICVEPAIDEYGASLLDRCDVLRIEADRERVTSVECVRDGQPVSVRARQIVLSAGTYRSAAMLLSSHNGAWPTGLGNQRGLVGRYLMFHSSDWFAVWPKRSGNTVGFRKAIGLRDLYAPDGMRLGSIQSTGLPAGYGNVLIYLYRWFDLSPLRRLRFLRPFLRIPAKIASIVFGNATIFAMIMEDFGDAENRIVHDPERPGRIIFRYRVSKDMADRTAAARRLVKQRMAGFRKYWLQPDVMVDLGHPSGTCRFGDDPATSVLDRNCRVHDLDNLYVVDGSFMPSSGGANPSLTIAANALRVAEAIGDRLRRQDSAVSAAQEPA